MARGIAAPFRIAVVALLAASTRALRRGSRRAGTTENHTQAGRIHRLYSFGSPGSASPGFTNPHDPRGCFPGMRAWTGRGYFGGGTGTSDIAPQLTWKNGFRHPMMDAVEMDVRGEMTVSTKACSVEAEMEPRNRLIDPVLHLRSYYIKAAHTESEALGNLTDMIVVGGYLDNTDYMKMRAEALGFRWIAMATHEGNQWNGGDQQVHLIQHPETLECTMTFQGADSIQDVVAHMDNGKASFCGLVNQNEVCNSMVSECEVQRPGGSFVHKGFRNHLRDMVRSNEYQTKIRPFLPACSKLNVGGFGLGGSMAELFAACLANAPALGAFGHEEDYQYVGFEKGPARQLWS